MKKLFTLIVAVLMMVTACFGMTGCSKNELKGFDIDLAREVGLSISLGKRILRTETAAVTALSMLMLYAEMKFE